MTFRPLALCLLAVSGCSTVDWDTVTRLSTLSPMQEDPGNFQVALDLPESVAIRPGSGKLTLTATQTALDQSVHTEATLIPVPSPSAGGPQGVGRVDHYRIDPNDVPELRRVQTLVNSWEAEDSDATQGSLSVTLAGCMTGRPEKTGETVSIWLQIEPDGPFLPLVKQAPKAQVLQEGGFEPLEPC